jgi:hypothetical protein
MAGEENGPAVPELARRMTICSCALDPARALDSVLAAIADRFPAAIAEGNAAAARAAYEIVAQSTAGSGRAAGTQPTRARPAGIRPAAAHPGSTVRQIEGSQAVAQAVALCRPEVICAYPISPQTHIVEALSRAVKSGDLTPCEFVNVESEFAAMSVAIGASAAGPRASGQPRNADMTGSCSPSPGRSLGLHDQVRGPRDR